MTMPNAPLHTLIEAALFYRGGSMTRAELSSALGVPQESIESALDALDAALSDGGIRLVREGEAVALATAPSAAALIEKMRTDELEGPLGKAALETLAVIVFRGPLPKSDIDYIRGVNCGYILRALMVRGLVERAENPADKRSFMYRATAQLPAHLGVSSLEGLPGYAETRGEIERVFADREALAAKERARAEETPANAT